MPGTNLLTQNDIEYRINRASAKVVVVSETHVEAVDKIKNRCPTLEHLIVVRGKRPGWYSFETICAEASEYIDRTSVPPTSSKDLILIYFNNYILGGSVRYNSFMKNIDKVQ